MGTFAPSPAARLAAVAGALALALAACGGSGGQKSGGKETIVFAEAGLGPEGKATQDAIKAFEQANPDITVKVQTLSADSTQYLQQLQQRLVAGSSTPDVIRVDETYPASLAKAGWLYDLGKFKPDLSGFLPAAVAPGKYNGKTYAVPWFAGAEGLYYRTDLVKKPPATPAELVSAAQAAMKKDPKIKYGLAFEGAKYEGAVTSFMVFAGAFGGKFDPANLNTPQNLQALQFAYDAVNTNRIAPKAVTGWKEGDVQQAFTSGQAAFSINWPFVFAASKGSPTEGKIGFVPLAGKGATLGIQNLAINAKSKHAEAAWKFIQYLTSVPAQVKRAVDAGDPPSVTAAYNDDLFQQAPYYKQVQKVAEVGAARPDGPQYLKISAAFQTAVSSVLSNLSKPDGALESASTQVKGLAG